MILGFVWSFAIFLTQSGLSFAQETAAFYSRIPPPDRALSKLNPEVERAEILLDGDYIKNIRELDKPHLKKAQLETQPWSDSYWPTAKGQTAHRYADPRSPKSYSWPTHYNHFLSRPPSSLVLSGDSIHLLSPAEKYDLLVGDQSWSITNHSWNTGIAPQRQFGFVPGWTGLCHGWAVASYMIPAPQKTVYVPSYNGNHTIAFYPSDIKALSSLLWANGIYTTRFAGQRCVIGRPQTDRIGRPLSEECHNINPGSWHLGIVNLIGVRKQSLVMDLVYNLQVWNHPLYSYELRYFNPQTLEITNRLSQAMVPVARFSHDKYKSYRDKETKFVVGVFMTVTYMTESRANHSENQENMKKSARYMYDLELDSEANIIGGEWYTNYHPDFIWTVSPQTRAIALGDRLIQPSDWDGLRPVPESWREAAKASSRRGQPLAAIIERLVTLSRPQ